MPDSMPATQPCEQFNRLCRRHGIGPTGFEQLTQGALKRSTVTSWHRTPDLMPRIDTATMAWVVLDALSRAQGAPGYTFHDVWPLEPLVPPALAALCLNLDEIQLRVKTLRTRRGK